MRLLLVSLKIPSEIQNITKVTLNRKTSAIKIAFVITAAKPYLNGNFEEPFPWWLQDNLDDIRKYGFSVEICDIEYLLDKKAVAEFYNRYDILFIAGGNCFQLMDVIRENNLENLIHNFIENKFYIGSSAGVAILHENLWPYRHVDSIDKVVSPPRSGLGLINFNVILHWGTEKFRERLEKVKEEYQKETKEIFFLQDNEALFVNDGKIIRFKVQR